MVSIFEENEKELTDIPEEIVNLFGYPCLANSLMFKEQEIPGYDKETILKYIKTHKFPTLNSLCDYICSLTNDIDKLFAIFCWEVLYIQYDNKEFKTEVKVVKNINNNTEDEYDRKPDLKLINEIFQKKRAVCRGYVEFFIELSKYVKVDKSQIRMSKYRNIAKSDNFNFFKPPTQEKSDHCSICVKINGIPYICEPTWATNLRKNPEDDVESHLFLIPIMKTISDHFPCNESIQLIPFKIKLTDFVKSSQISINQFDLKTETNPFSIISCQNGYLEQTFSCNGPVDLIRFNVYLVSKNGYQNIGELGITSYEIIQKKLPNHPNRCRFRVFNNFQQKGQFQVVMFINKIQTLKYIVNCQSKSSNSIPVNFNVFNLNKFIPVFPKNTLTQVRESFVLVRFAVDSEKSDFHCNLKKLSNEKVFDLNGTVISCPYKETVQLPFDNQMCENRVLINFPSNGRYLVQLFLTGVYFSSFYFDVSGVTKNSKQMEFSDFDLFDDESKEEDLPQSEKNVLNELKRIIELEKDENAIININSEEKIEAFHNDSNNSINVNDNNSNSSHNVNDNNSNINVNDNNSNSSHNVNDNNSSINVNDNNNNSSHNVNDNNSSINVNDKNSSINVNDKNSNINVNDKNSNINVNDDNNNINVNDDNNNDKLVGGVVEGDKKKNVIAQKNSIKIVVSNTKQCHGQTRQSNNNKPQKKQQNYLNNGPFGNFTRISDLLPDIPDDLYGEEQPQQPRKIQSKNSGHAKPVQDNEKKATITLNVHKISKDERTDESKDKPRPVSRNKAEGESKDKPRPVSRNKVAGESKDKPRPVSRNKVAGELQDRPRPVSRNKAEGETKDKPRPVSRNKAEGESKDKPIPVSRNKVAGELQDRPRPVSRNKAEGETKDKPRPVSRNKTADESKDKPRPVSRNKAEGETKDKPRPVSRNKAAGGLQGRPKQISKK